MTDTQTTSLCRLTVRAPGRTIDLGVPADIPVSDLLPTLIGYAGDDLEESGLEHEGWVLQRLGGPPLDPESTLDALGLRDGDVLYLRPRTEALPDVHLDDLVDGIATTMRQRPHGWSPAASRRLLRGLTVTVLLLGIVILSLSGADARPTAVAAGLIGLLLVAGAGTASRAVGDAGAGTAIGLMVAPYFALAGWLSPGGELSGPDDSAVLGARLLASSAAAAGGAVLALAATGVAPALFLCVTAVAFAGALGAAPMLIWDLGLEQTSSVLALAAVIFGGFVPSLSFRLSGMRMPPLPSNAQQLQEGIDPYPTRDVEERSVLADGWMTGFYGSVGLICAGCLTALTFHFELPEILTSLALILLLLLHSRGLGNVWQRLALTSAGIWGAVLLMYRTADGLELTDRLILTAGLLMLAAAIAIASWTVPGRRLVPYWGRAAELLHSAAAISMLPLTLWCLGVYSAVRNITS